MNDPRDAFREEAFDLLAELETALMELEDNPADKELIDRVFRAMHTIKGSGAMFGFNEIADFTHKLETAFDLVRDNQMPVTEKLVTISLMARDKIKAMLQAPDDAPPTDDEGCRTIIREIDAMVAESVPDEDVSSSADEQDPTESIMSDSSDDADGAAIFRIRFRPGPDLFKTGTNPLLLLDELRELGTCTVIASTSEIPPLEEIDPEACYTAWDVVLTTDRGENAIRDVFIFVEDDCRIDIQPIELAIGKNIEAEAKKIGQILIERGDVNSEALEAVLKEQPRIGELLVGHKIVNGTAIKSALAEQAHVRQAFKQIKDSAAASTVRVASDKLDMLVDLVGELVTVQARLSQKADAVEDADLSSIAEVVERLTTELRDNTMSIRMMPFGTTFTRFKRLVRDLSSELGKQVVLTTVGGETELDKTVIEQLNDPLVHILRNSIDHGIEPPGVREAIGKPIQGTIHLSAEHSGGYVLIRISDDGTGLDTDAIRSKAIEKGLMDQAAVASNREIYNLIFSPGFSTTTKVTSVSGRGVGMDVVKRGIDLLRGSIDIDSTPGKGTVITLKLPLTLAIIDGLLVEADGDKYVLPLAVVEECVELNGDDRRRTNGRNILNIRGEMVPYVSLRERFKIAGDRPPLEQIVVNDANGRRVGIVVDRVIGQHQIVIKTMSTLYGDVNEVSGATILGDGTIALILDIPGLIGTDSETRQVA